MPFARFIPAWRQTLAMGLVIFLSAPLACAPWRHAPPPESSQQPAQASFGTQGHGRISVREDVDRPRITTVSREGDPAGAVAAVVLTGDDSARSVALAAVVRERLHRAGLTNAGVSADRFGYRAHTLVTTPDDAQAFLRSLRRAFEQPIEPGSEELSSVQTALRALRRQPLDGPELEPVAACTGELGEPASAPQVDPTTAEGANRIETWRTQSHGAQRIAIAVVGSAELGAAVEAQVAHGPPWPKVPPPADAWPKQDHVAAYPLPGPTANAPRLTVAARVGPTFAVSALAESAFAPQSPFARKLVASTSWRLQRTTATVRPRGACLAITIDRDPARKDANLANDAARMAAMITHDIQFEVEHAKADASMAATQVLSTSDPREAASLAAWWSHAARLEPGTTRFAVALGVPPEDGSPKSVNLEKQTRTVQNQLRSALPVFEKNWDQLVVDAATRVETGQGELWLLLASPCGTSSESKADAGFSALASAAAARANHGVDDVHVEPWIAQDGVGVIAHASARGEESPAGLARRVANVAGAALLGPPPPHHLVTAARARLLSLIEASTGRHSEPFGLLAHALEPEHPAWLAPFGLRKAMVEGDVRSIELRRSALSDGPLRVAVLANDDAEQADLAIQTVDQWLVHRGTPPRACPPVTPPSKRASGVQDLTFQSVDRPPHALLGIALRAPSEKSAQMLALLREALTGPRGWMTMAFRSFDGPVRFDVRILGHRRVNALVIEVHCADELLDRAVQQTRAVLARLRQGAATEENLQRATQRLERRQLEAQLEPRHRLVRTWRGAPEPPEPPSLSEWKAWLSRTLPDDAITIVTVRPPRPETTDEE